MCNRIVIIHNGQVRADGTPQELLEQTQTRHLEEAYVALTADVARPRQEDDKPFPSGLHGGEDCSRQRHQGGRRG